MRKMSPRLLAAAIAALGCVFAPLTFARDNFVLFEAEAPSCIAVDGEIWFAAGRHWSYNPHDRCGIWKYDPVADRETLYQNHQLPGYVFALAQSDSLIYAGGLGLSVYNKRVRSWHSLPQYDTLVIEDMAVGDSSVWLATSGHGIIASDRYPWPWLSRRRITKAQGLSSNRVLSLYLQGDTLFAATYRFGTGTWPERREDLYGLGLQAVNTRTSSVRDVRLPHDSIIHQHKEWMVTEMYRSPDDSNALRVELWQPWEIYHWDYRHAERGVIRDSSRYASPEGALQMPGMPTDSVQRDRVRSFIRRHL